MRRLIVPVAGVDRELFYFQVSPFKNGASSETKTSYISVKTIGNLKTWPTQGAPHIFLTADMFKLLTVYLNKHRKVIKNSVGQQVFCGFYGSEQKSNHAARTLRESLKKMGLEKITSGRKLTPNLVRKSIWTISEQTINLQREMTTDIVAHSAGHRNTTGVMHYRLLGREEADRTIAKHNLNLFLTYHLNPKLLDELEREPERGVRINIEDQYDDEGKDEEEEEEEDKYPVTSETSTPVGVRNYNLR